MNEDVFPIAILVVYVEMLLYKEGNTACFHGSSPKWGMVVEGSMYRLNHDDKEHNRSSSDRIVSCVNL